MVQKNSISRNLVENSVKKRIPLACHIDLTYKCNLNCIHCYVKKEPLKELDTKSVKEILNQLASAGTLNLVLSGGEIFLRQDLLEILKHAREKHFAIRILTNGTLIDEIIADKLADLYLDKIAISIFSMKPEIHDNITSTPGSLNKALNAIILLKERDLPIRINFTVLNKNFSELKKVYEFSNKIGTDFKTEYEITPQLDGNPLPKKYQASTNDIKNLISYMLKNSAIEDNSDSLHHFSDDFYDYLCLAGHNSLYISPYGDVYPCVQFPLNCGNLNQRSLKDIWYNSSNLKKIISLRMSKLPHCSKCDLIDFCRYCPGYAYLEEKNLLSPPKRNCQEAIIYKEIYKELKTQN